MTEDDNELTHARDQGQAQFEHIKELVEALEADGGDNESNEKALQAIHEHPLSVLVREGWHEPGKPAIMGEPGSEFEILLCTGGPLRLAAVRIIGTLNVHAEPETARLEVQDWFQPWTEFWPAPDGHGPENADILLRYARCFHFGE